MRSNQPLDKELALEDIFILGLERWEETKKPETTELKCFTKQSGTKRNKHTNEGDVRHTRETRTPIDQLYR